MTENSSSVRTRRTRSRIAVLLAAVGLALMSTGVVITAAASVEPAVTDSAKTCDQLGYEKVEGSSGTVVEDFGEITWSGETLTYDILEGYSVSICIKAGTEVDTDTVVVGPDEGSVTIDKEISHIGYLVSSTPPSTPPTSEPPSTPPTSEPPSTPPTSEPPTVAPTEAETTTPPTSEAPTVAPTEAESTPPDEVLGTSGAAPTAGGGGGAQALPTSVAAGLGATSNPSLVATLGKSLMGAGLVLLLAGAWTGFGRQTRGAHQI